MGTNFSIPVENALMHHGIKGQKWGVRRFQNEDGSLTEAGKIRYKARDRIVRSESTTKDVEDIIGTMNKKEQQFVLAGSDHYLNVEERSTIAKRVVVRDKNGTPVSFFDLLEDGKDDLQVALGTRSGSQYRGKGYASKAAQEAINWVDRNQDKIGQKNLIWGVHVDNIGSIKIAEKNGFELDKNSYSSDGKWVNYVRPVHYKPKMEHSDCNYLEHHGIKGQKWGVRRFQNPDGSLTEAGKRRYATVFVSGSSKTQTEDSPYRRDELPKAVQDELNRHMSLKSKFVVGDAPGIDRQVQDYLNRANYSNVSVYGPGTAVRYQANKNWKTHTVNTPEYEVGSKEWLAAKDIAMEKVSTEGLAVVLDEGAKATRKNVERLVQNGKTVMVYELNKNGANYDRWIDNARLRHSAFLMHHGIKGQKWGIRRFQNPDGSLTETGKSRYGSQEASYKKAADEAYSAYRSGNKAKVQEIGEKLVQDWAKSTGKDAFDFIQEHIDKMDDERGNADDLTYLMNEVIPDKYWEDFYEKYFNAKHGGNMSDGNYLAHHGIKGQKWGIRRFQNPDGSLTEAGKRRYGTVENFNRAMEKKAGRKRIAAKVGIGAAATAGAIAGMHEIGRRKNSGSEWLNPTIKGGKDKPNKSPAEKVMSDAGKTISEASRAVDAVHRLNSRDEGPDPSIRSMSDDDLRRAINRINLERQYSNLTREETSDGYKKVKDILDVVGPVVGVAAGIAGIAGTVYDIKNKVQHEDASTRFDYGNYLMHHGIKGQKWGIRRFQNEDGSLTPEGKLRYGTDVTKIKTKDLAKQVNALGYAVVRDGSNSRNVGSVSRKIEKEVEKTDEYKAVAAVNDALEKLQEEANRRNGGKEATVVVGQQFKDEYDELLGAYNNKYNEIYKKYTDKMTGAVLKDLGYDDTKEGREYLKKLGLI